jgi:GNAT superfamily N-acetyltransferase
VDPAPPPTRVNRAPPPTRRATLEDVPDLARMLTRAFLDDPVAQWSCRSQALRPRVLEDFYAVRTRQMLAEQEVWITPQRSSAALWTPPECWRTTVRQDLELARCLLHPRLLARMPMIVAGLIGVERAHPAQPPHWYLGILGTDPAVQGAGHGSAVLAPVLRRCDSDGVGAYLESSKERNLDFYARHGFRVTRELRLPRGPKMWGMWRDPAV